MVVTVKLFGPEAKAAGLRAVAVDLGGASETTCLELRERLIERVPALTQLISNCRFAVNHEFVDLTCALLPSDEVALIGMVFWRMSVTVSIIAGPLPACATAWTYPGAGALFCFDGVVRPSEDGRAIVALEYEAYEPMASRMLEKIAQELFTRHGLLAIRVEHSVGRVANGEVSYRLRIASKHRKEGIAALDEFTDRLKKDVPIWKTAVLQNEGA